MEVILLAVIVVLIILVVQKRKAPAKQSVQSDAIGNQEDAAKTYTYQKKCLMTPIEKQFFAAIKDRVGGNYIVLPQVNLATVIKKQGEFKFQNELYRNIDFGIFDMDYNVLVLIEINDASHDNYHRRERDAKIKNLISSAGIPLVTFHTKYGVNGEYIAKRLGEHISL